MSAFAVQRLTIRNQVRVMKNTNFILPAKKSLIAPDETVMHHTTESLLCRFNTKM